jgi:hypothetical protein
MMRSFIVFILFCVGGAQILVAQQAETLVSGDVEHGGFGSLLYGVTSVNGEAAYLTGTRGAWMIKFRDGHALNIGLGSYRTRSGFHARPGRQTDAGEAWELQTNYGGLELEYLNRSHRLVHYGAQTTIGGGEVRYRDRNRAPDRTSDSYFVLQPGVNVHLNVTRWFRMSGGVFYRYAGGVSLEGTSNSDLSGVSAAIGLRFGKF